MEEQEDCLGDEWKLSGNQMEQQPQICQNFYGFYDFLMPEPSQKTQVKLVKNLPDLSTNSLT
jgi:hypothetical protein